MNAPLDRQQALQPDAISLDDKYTLDRGRVFLTGTQAIIRLPMMQRQRDLAAGLILRDSLLVIAAHRWALSIKRR